MGIARTEVQSWGVKHLAPALLEALLSSGLVGKVAVLICWKSGKTPWKYGQKCRPTLFDFKIWCPMFSKKLGKTLFLALTPKKTSSWFLWEIMCLKKSQNNVSSQCGEYWAKIFRIPQNLGALTLVLLSRCCLSCWSQKKTESGPKKRLSGTSSFFTEMYEADKNFVKSSDFACKAWTLFSFLVGVLANFTHLCKLLPLWCIKPFDKEVL